MRTHENSISSSRRYLLYYKTATGKQKPLKNVENVSRFFPRQLILHLSHCLLVEAELEFMLCLEKHELRADLSYNLHLLASWSICF